VSVLSDEIISEFSGGRDFPSPSDSGGAALQCAESREGEGARPSGGTVLHCRASN
jgi:hypothetical protein